MRIRTDDEIYRIRLLWIGVKGFVWPFEASFLAWGVWGLVTVLYAIVAGVLPGVALYNPAVIIWVVALSALTTRFFIMPYVSSERSLRSLFHSLFCDAHALWGRVRGHSAGSSYRHETRKLDVRY